MAFAFFDEPAPRRKTLKDWRPILHEVQKSKCMYCGVKIRKGDGHVDHKKPVALGGKETPKNMQLLCQPCNTRKGKLTDAQFKKRFKSVLPATLPPARTIPLTKFQAVAKEVASKKAKAARKRRQEEDNWLFF